MIKNTLNIKTFTNTLICLSLLYLNGMATNGIFGEVFQVLGYMPLFIMLLPLLSIMLYKEGIKTYLTKENIVVAVFILISLVSYFIGGESSYLATALEIGVFALIYNIYLFCKRNNTNKENKIIVLILVFNFVLTCAASICYLIKDPEIIRFTATRLKPGIAKKFNLNTTFLLGTIATQYAAIAFMLVCLDKVIKKQYLYFIAMAICGIFFILSDSFMALIEMIFSIIVYIFIVLCKQKGIKKSLIISGSLCVIIVILVLLTFKLNLLPKTMAIRINEIIMTLFGSIDFSNLIQVAKEYLANPTKYVPGNTDIECRLIVYICSFIGIVQNKFIINPTNVLSGNHSTILDTMSIYGFISLILFYWIYKTIKNTYAYVFKGNEAVCIAIFAFVIISFLLDPCLNIDLALMIYFICPFLLQSERGNDD